MRGWLDDVDELSRLPTDQDLGNLELTTLQYYLRETNPANGLVRDKTDPLIWNIMRRSPHVVSGLRRAGFQGGWL